MARMTNTIEIEAPAEEVWEVLGPGFADIGRWATAVPRSEPGLTRDPGAADAPVGSRVCETTIKGMETPTETLIAYDAVRRSFTFRITSGLPGFIRDARNTWRVEELGATRSRVALDGRIELAGLARVLDPMMALNLRRTLNVMLRDLKHYVENGVPSPRKLRQQVKRAA